MKDHNNREKAKIKLNNLILTKANKGSTTITSNKKDYGAKIINICSTTNPKT
jgi:hypothetical protein